MSVIFNLLAATGTLVDRLQALIEAYPHEVIQHAWATRAVDLQLELIITSDNANAASLDYGDAQQAVTDWYDDFKAAGEQVAADRQTIAMAVKLKPKDAAKLWSRQNERERQARRVAYADFFRLVACRADCLAALNADLHCLTALLRQATDEIAEIEAAAEQHARTEELRRARLAREAALAAEPPRKYSATHVAEVMSAVHKAERAAHG